MKGIKEHHTPVTIQVYLGSGESGEKLRYNLIKLSATEGRSLSSVIVRLLRDSNPELFKGVNDGKK